jgi:GNAT superfamily N-acetyltransferase
MRVESHYGDRVRRFSTLEDVSPWQPGFEQRLRRSYGAAGYAGAAVDHHLDQIRGKLADWSVAEITAAGVRVGFVAVVVAAENGTSTGRIGDLWIDRTHAGRGHEQSARAWAERWCAERGATRVSVRLIEPAELFDDYPVRAQTRMRVITSAPEPLDDVTARPMTETEYPQWLAAEKAAYVADIVRAGALPPEAARMKSDTDYAELIPQGLATEGNSFLVLERAGVAIGTGWLKHGHMPGITFGYSLEVHAEHRGRGYGRAAMAVGEQATVAAGDSALMFNVFGGNSVAMNLYTSAGYRVVEEMRSIELSPETGAVPQP